MKNILNRQFDGQGYRDAVIRGLTYVRVGTLWNYICVPVGLHNRDIRLFHTDRGNEAKNQIIEMEVIGLCELVYSSQNTFLPRISNSVQYRENNLKKVV